MGRSGLMRWSCFRHGRLDRSSLLRSFLLGCLFRSRLFGSFLRGLLDGFLGRLFHGLLGLLRGFFGGLLCRLLRRLLGGFLLRSEKFLSLLRLLALLLFRLSHVVLLLC